MEISNSNNFETLFCYDWFLIELGTHLITPGDVNLLNVLCLNRKINARATSIFRTHFLDFKLQEQLKILISNLKFDEIEKLFEKKGLSLNPNVKMHFGDVNEIPPETIFCFFYAFQSIKVENLPLFLASLRYRRDSLSQLLLLHPRMNLRSLNILPQFREVLCWSIQCLKFELTKEILSVIDDDHLHEMLHEIHLQFLFTISKFDNWKHQFKICVDQFPVLTFKVRGYYESFLRMALFRGRIEVVVVCHYISKTQSTDGLAYLREDYIDDIMKRLLEHKSVSIQSVEDEIEDSKTALTFAFMFGRDAEFKLLIEERKWDDQFLLDLLKREKIFVNLAYSENSTTCNYFNILKLLLANLSENAVLSNIDDMLTQFSRLEFLEHFKLIWNDKRFRVDSKWVLDFICPKFSTVNSQEIVVFVTENFPLSSPMTTTLTKTLKIESEFRNCCFLDCLSYYFEKSDFDWIEKCLKITWSQQLLEWSLEIANGSALGWLLNNSLIDSNFWSEKFQQISLVKSCSYKYRAIELFELVLRKFPKINLSSNQNEAFRVLLEGFERTKHTEEDVFEIFSEFEKRIQFNNEQEREYMSKLTTMTDFSERILKMSILKH